MRKSLAGAIVGALVAVSCGTGGEDVAAPPLVTIPLEPSADEPVAPTSSEAEATPDPAIDPGTTDPAPILPEVSIEQVDCPAEIQLDELSCGLATVPVDRTDPTSGATTISIGALRGTDATASPPLAVLQGGPGGASTDLPRFYPQRNYTQVFIDQRGTGFGASDFDCPEVDEALVEILTSSSDDGEDVELAAYERCAARLRDDPTFVVTDTETHARDVVDVMNALGYERWVVYGVSYGTTIALELLGAPPAGLVGAILDSVYPADLDVDVAIGRSADSSLAELDSACASDPGCAAVIDDLSGSVEDLMGRLEAEPITVAVGEGETLLGVELEVVLDDEVLAGMIFRFLYDESRLSFVPGLLDGLDRGDPGTARWLAREVVNRSVSALASNDDGTWFAVQCADRLPFTLGPAPDLSDYAAAIAVPGLAELCDPWQREPAPAGVGEPVSSDLPALIVGGQFDPITPPDYALRVAERLSRSTVVIRPGRSHGVWYGDDCVAGLVDAFMLDPGASLDTSCAAIGVPVNWRRPVG